MTVLYNTALGVIFGVKKYAERLMKVVEKRCVSVYQYFVVKKRFISLVLSILMDLMTTTI